MAKGTKRTATPKRGRMRPNVPKAGFKPGHRYGCGGHKAK